MTTRRRLAADQQRPARIAASGNVARCKHCLAQICWVQRPEGGVYPPMVIAGPVFALAESPDQDGLLVAQSVQVLIRHRCDPAEVAEVQQYEAARRSQVAEQQAQAREHLAVMRQRASAAEEAYRVALPLSCPTCGQEPGMRCLNLNKVLGRKGSEGKPDHTRWPHPDRVALAETSGSAS